MRAVAGRFCASGPLLRMQLSSACRAQEPPQRVLSQRGNRKTTFLKSRSRVPTEIGGEKAALKMEPKKRLVDRVQASTFRKSADAIDLDPSFSGPGEPHSSVDHHATHPKLPSHEPGVLSYVKEPSRSYLSTAGTTRSRGNRSRILAWFARLSLARRHHGRLNREG